MTGEKKSGSGKSFILKIWTILFILSIRIIRVFQFLANPIVHSSIRGRAFRVLGTFIQGIPGTFIWRRTTGGHRSPDRELPITDSQRARYSQKPMGNWNCRSWMGRGSRKKAITHPDVGDHVGDSKSCVVNIGDNSGKTARTCTSEDLEDRCRTLTAENQEHLAARQRSKLEVARLHELLKVANGKYRASEENCNLLQNESERLRREIIQEKESHKEVSLRLSKSAAESLKQNNPTLENLSTQNRSLILRDRFKCDLYGNVWCSALTDLQDHHRCDEETSLAFLCNLVMNSYRFCSKMQESVVSRTVTTLSLGAELNLEDRLCQNIQYSLREIIRRIVDERTVQQLFMEFETSEEFHSLRAQFSIGENLSRELLVTLKKFILLSLELSWMFVIQDPTMTMTDILPEDGSVEDSLYRFYNKSAPKAKFVVWPALLLHERGLILEKGTVFGCLPE